MSQSWTGPGAGHGPEVAPAVVAVQTGAAVHTVAAAQVVPVVIVVVHAAQVGDQAALGLVAAHAFGLLAVADVLAGRRREVGRVAGQVVAVLVVDLEAEQGIQVVHPGEGLRIGELVGPHELVHLVEAGGHFAHHVVTVGGAGVGPVLALGEHEVVGDGGLELEVGDELVLRPGGVEGTGHPVLLVVVGLGEERVAVAVADKIAVPGAVLVVGGVGRGDAVTGAVERGGVGGTLAVEVLVHLGEQDVRAQGQAVRSTVFHVHAAGDALHRGSGGDTLLVHIVRGGEVLHAVGTAGDGGLIVGVLALAEQDLVPVHIAAPRNGGVVVDVRIGIGLGVGVGFAAPDGVVVQAGPHVFPALLAAHHRTERHREVGHAPVGLQAHLRLAGLALLGGDDDDAVRGAGAVQGGGRRILDDGDALDVAGVQGGHDVQTGVAAGHADVTAADRNAVHHIERGIAGVEGAHAADVQRGSGTRLTGGLAELDAGCVALQHVLEGHGRDVGQFLLFHVGCRAGIGRFLEGTVTGDDNFVHQDGFGLQGNMDGAGGRDLYFLVGIAQTGDHEGGRQGGDLQGEPAVQVGDCPDLGAFYHHACPDDGFIRLGVGHDTLETGGRREGRSQGKEAGQQHRAAAKKLSPQRFHIG